MTTLQELASHLALSFVLYYLEAVALLFWKPAFYLLAIVRLVVSTAHAVLFAVNSKNKIVWRMAILGSVLNTLAILANGGKMPVFTKDNRELSGIHKKGGRNTRLRILCDIFPSPEGAIFSVGDMLIFASLLWLLARTIRESLSNAYRLRNKVLFITGNK